MEFGLNGIEKATIIVDICFNIIQTVQDTGIHLAGQVVTLYAVANPVRSQLGWIGSGKKCRQNKRHDDIPNIFFFLTISPPPPDWVDAFILILIFILIEGLDAFRFFFQPCQESSVPR